MNNDFMFDNLIKGLDKGLQAQLSYYFRKEMILKDFANSKEMQKIKADITRDVMNSISIDVENKVRQVLDELFKELNL